MPQEESEGATTTEPTEPVSTPYVKGLLQSFAEGDSEPLAANLGDEVQDDLLQMLTQKMGMPEPIFDGTTV